LKFEVVAPVEEVLGEPLHCEKIELSDYVISSCAVIAGGYAPTFVVRTNFFGEATGLEEAIAYAAGLAE
jgi:hypothetical protein